MKHEDEEYVQLMYKYAATLEMWVTSGEITFDKLGRSDILQAAVVKYLELIGEEATILRRRGYDLGPKIDLINMSGMRHRLVHAYEGIDWNYVEQAVWTDVPQLVADLRELMVERDIKLPALKGSVDNQTARKEV